MFEISRELGVFGLSLMVPAIGYIRYGLGFTVHTEAETKIMINRLSELKVPFGDSMWGTSEMPGRGSLQCGTDDYVLPNGKTSGWLKSELEGVLNAAGFKQEDWREVMARNSRR